MVRISPDVGRNRVVIQLIGSPTPAELAMGERDLIEALSRLRPSIDVLADVRELESLEAMPAEDFTRLARVLSDFGTRKVVRVVGKSAHAAVQMARLSRSLKGHTPHLAFSLEEAEQVFGK